MKRKSFIKSLIGLIVAPFAVLKVCSENKKEISSKQSIGYAFEGRVVTPKWAKKYIISKEAGLPIEDIIWSWKDGQLTQAT